MQANSLRASQLLSSYLGRKNEKIGQSIAQSDFAGELKRFMPASSTDAPTVCGSAAASSTETEPISRTASNAKTGRTRKSSRSAKEAEKTSDGTEKADAKTKLKNIKTRAKNSEQLYIANPAAIETILADLQYPAETIQAYKSLQNKEGMISVKDLKSLLERQPGPVGDAEQGRISSEKAQALLGAIVARESGQVTHKFGNGKLAASLGVTANSSYSASEFRDLVDRVLQMNNGQTDLDKKTQPEVNIASQVSSAARAGQTKSLASSSLPPFLKEKDETALKTGSDAAKARAAIANPETASPAAAGGKPGAVRPDATGEIAGALSAGLTASSEAKGAAGFDKQVRSNAVPGAVSAPSTAASTGEQAAEAMKIEDLAAEFEKLNGRIVSVESAKAAIQGENPLESASPEDIVSQAQNLSVAARDAEKQASKISSSEAGEMKDIGEILRPNQITTDPADGDQGHSRDSGSDGRFGMIAENVRKAAQEKTDGSPDVDFASIELGESDLLRGANQKSAVDRAALPQDGEEVSSGLKKATAENGDQLAQRANVHSAKDPSAESADAAASAEGGKRSRVVVPGAGNAAQVSGKGAAGSANLAGANAASARNFDAEAGWSGPAEGRGLESQAAELSASTAAKLETTVLTGGKAQTGAHGESSAATEINPGGWNRDAAPEWTIVQNRVEDFQGARINVGSMQNASGNGFSFYDPYHAVDLAQSAREAAESVENGLTLEIDPDELGKMRIKVGAKNSDVSAVVTTESESARQALVKGAPELRQNLQDQGLSLGKFMVDVNRERSGGNGQEARDFGASNFSLPQSDKTSQKPSRAQPVYRPASGSSQINIFA